MVYSLAFYGVLILGTIAALIFVALHLHYRIVDLQKAIKVLRADILRLHTEIYRRARKPVEPRYKPFKPRLIEGPMVITKDGREATADVRILPTRVD